MSSARANAETFPSKYARASDLVIPDHYGETHMGLHIGNNYRPATFHCMRGKTDQKAIKDTVRGARVRRIRLEMELNQTELAEKIGVDQSTVSDIENGAGFSADLLMRLADVLGVSPGILMRGYDETSWPFEHVAIEEVLALNPLDRSYVEGRLVEYLGQVVPPKPLPSKSLNPSRRRVSPRQIKRSS